MKRRQHIVSAVICLICLTVSAAFPQTASAAAAGTAEVVIFHTNDTHGYLTGDGESTVGLDKVAALKKSEPESVLVDAGDATQGLPVASLTRGRDVIRLMNLAGYDVMAAGNHEFDFGTEQFLANAAAADFPILAANVYRDGRLLLSGVQEGNSGDHVILERKGVRIGFFGLTTAETAVAVNPMYVSGLTFRNEVETAKEQIDDLKDEGADVIIAVCHMGDGGAPCNSTQLAEALTGEYQNELDAIIDGHSHTVENREVNGVAIVQTGTGLSAVGRLELQISGDEVKVSEQLLTPKDLAGLAGDEAVADELSRIEASQAAMLDQTVGTVNTTLWAGTVGGISVARAVETNFGDFAADAFREAGIAFLKNTGEDRDIPVIAVENGGGIRASLHNGDITLGDLISAFPYSNTLYMKEITPALLYQIMEISAGSMDGQDGGTGMLLQQDVFGGFLQISGFNVEFNPDAPAGERVVSIAAEGFRQPLSRSDTSSKLLLVSNNYIMSGGNGYDVLAQLPKKGEAGGELETIQGYLEECIAKNTLKSYAVPAGRIVIKGDDYEPHDYTASVRITDKNGAAADRTVIYRVDGGSYQEGVTDAEGILRITVSDGAHSIRLHDGQKDVYTDNYTGIGLVEDGIRSFPSLELTENAGQTGAELTFSDIAEDAWYRDAVSFVCEKGLMQGSGEMFYPEQNTSRAMAVTVLWRLAGSPEAEKNETFSDAESDAYYAGALDWAAEAGIAAGTAPGIFRPEEPVSREQLAVFLYRFAESQNCDISVSTDPVCFRDADNIDAYAASAVKWACDRGILKGTAEGVLSPDTSASRAQMAEIVMRMSQDR